MSNRLAVFESFVGRERALCESGLGAEKATALKLLSEAGTLPLSREAHRASGLERGELSQNPVLRAVPQLPVSARAVSNVVDDRGFSPWLREIVRCFYLIPVYPLGISNSVESGSTRRTSRITLK